MKNNFLIIYFILSVFIMPQDYPNGSLNIENIIFQLKTLNIKGSDNKDSLNNGQLNLNNFAFGFNDISVSKKSNNKVKIGIEGPNLQLEGLEFTANYFLQNFYNILLRDLSINRYETPSDALEILEKAVSIYQNKNDKLPSSYNDLIVSSLIDGDLYPFNQKGWAYNFYLPDSIVAIPTTSNPNKNNSNLLYEWQSKKIINRETKLLNNNPIYWDINYKIRNIEQKFMSNIEINLGTEKNSYELFQRNGLFSINDLSIYVVPKDNIFQQSIIKLNNISLNTKDIYIHALKVKDKYIIENGRLKFILSNFEIKIPELLTSDNSISDIMHKLGIRNGLFRVRKVDFDLNFYDNEFGSFRSNFISSFLKVKLNGQFSMNTNKSIFKSIDFFNTEIRISPISYGVRDLIRVWEIENEKNLYREGPVIVLSLNGPFDNLIIKGIE